ncbi:hypothetical protein H6F93_01795 [Leptolyngbya sp. FACHB-671]|nr:hypothetical protein [Leptolyngbya sp. FACHB-671]
MGLIITSLLWVMASLSTSWQVSTPPPEPALVQLEQARTTFNQRLFKIREERRRDDFNPDYPTNFGDIQALIQARGAALKQRVDTQIATEGNPNYGQHPDWVYQSVRAETMKLLVLAANRNGAVLTYVDPSTGQKFDLSVSPEDLAQFAVAKLEAINYAQDSKVQQTVELNELRKDVAAQEEEIKSTRAQVLDASGQTKVSQTLPSKDVYGLSVRSESMNYVVPGAPQF